ncbi:MAG TPA: glycosyltransferase family 2 protein [Alphaproteobacteria bacterium]|nr:glycosyltransferase family 2 protein [Alphaproteobacteria bacterium]
MNVPEPAASNPLSISIVVPMYNEAANVASFFGRLLPTLDRLGLDYEVVCVDDGSSDATRELLLAARGETRRVKIVGLSRNFGKEVALTAGLRYARGAAVVPIDADLQHPPELIPALVEKWQEGFDVVYAVRRSRAADTALRRLSARLFYWIFDRLSDVSMPRDAGDFRLLDRRVVDVINTMPERSRFMKGIFAWVGFRQVGVQFDPDERFIGKSKWGFGRLFHYAADALTAFSNFPLIAWGYIGAIIAFVSLAAGAFFIVRTLILGVDVPGYASLIVAVLFFGGMQLLTLGIIGGYLGRVFEEVKRRPLYVVAETWGFEEAGSS